MNSNISKLSLYDSLPLVCVVCMQVYLCFKRIIKGHYGNLHIVKRHCDSLCVVMRRFVCCQATARLLSSDNLSLRSDNLLFRSDNMRVIKRLPVYCHIDNM